MPPRKSICVTCHQPFTRKARKRGGPAHRDCLSCWRIKSREPEVATLFADFEILLAAGLTVQRASELMKTPPETISRWRHGRRNPTLAQILRLNDLVHTRLIQIASQ